MVKQKNSESVTYDAIVMAFDCSGELSEDPLLSHSALVPLHGKPLLDWVVDALHHCRCIDQITVIGPEALNELLSTRHINRLLSPPLATLSNLYASENNSRGYIILPAEAVYLSPTTIENLIADFERSSADMGIPFIAPETYPPLAPESSSIEWENRMIIPGVVSFVKNLRMIPAAMHKLRQLNRNKGILTGSGVLLPAVAALEVSVLERTALKMDFFESCDPKVTLCIHSLHDLQYARKTLPEPYHPPFKKVMLIMNPRSGQGVKLPGVFQKLLGLRKRVLDKVSNTKSPAAIITGYLNEYGIDPQISIGKSAADAEATARRSVCEGYDLVIAAGGDGTINAVINGMAWGNTAFGVIPLGTVNLYAMQLQIPTGLRASCQLLAEGRSCRIDLGKADKRYFVCLSGIGFDAFVIRVADSRLKKSLGAAAYILTGLLNLPRYPFKNVNVMIESDGKQINTKGYTVIIGNGRYYSANISITPEARIDDGFLDVVLFRRRNLLSFFGYMRDISKGELSRSEGVEYYRSKSVYVNGGGRHLVHIDGEPFGHTPVAYGIAPKALKVIC